jgi:hypothetical protein
MALSDPGVDMLDPGFYSGADGGPSPVPGLQIMASLSASLASLAATAQADYARKQRLAQEMRWAPLAAIQANPQTQTTVAGTVVLSNAETWGPKTGYFWAIQRFTVAGLGTSDVVIIYKGSVAGVPGAVPQNQVSGPIGAATQYNPGRTDLILQPGDFLTVYGTGLTSTSITASADMIVGTIDTLADFLV